LTNSVRTFTVQATAKGHNYSTFGTRASEGRCKGSGRGTSNPVIATVQQLNGGHEHTSIAEQPQSFEQAKPRGVRRFTAHTRAENRSVASYSGAAKRRSNVTSN
jgi:hypothetical protein